MAASRKTSNKTKEVQPNLEREKNGLSLGLKEKGLRSRPAGQRTRVETSIEKVVSSTARNKED